jgi:hypothetical protein
LKDVTMTAQNLSTVTTGLITTYGNTARNLVNAYRMGNERVAGLVDQRWESAVMKSARKLSAEVRGNALAAEKKLSGYFVKGITLSSDGADIAITRAVELAAKGVQQVAANASAFEKATGNKSLNKIADAAVPAALAVSKVAEKIEVRTTQLAQAVAGSKTAATVSAVKRTVRKARKAA